jgi:hypothetical protein
MPAFELLMGCCAPAVNRSVCAPMHLFGVDTLRLMAHTNKNQECAALHNLDAI